MRYAIIVSGAVDNIAIADDPAFAAQMGWAPEVDGAGRRAQIGDLWDGTHFGDSPAPMTPVPQSVTMRQARLALLAHGLLSTVDTVIDALPEPQQSAARVEWDYSSSVERDRPFVLLLGPALGLDAEHLDGLFIEAAGL